MKLLFCDVRLYGQLNFRGNIIKHFAEQGHEIVLVSPADNEFTCEINIPNVRHISIDMTRSSINPIHDLKYFLLLKKIYKQEHPDYIFHYSIKPNIYGTLAAKTLHIPSTAMIAGLGYVFYQQKLTCKIARYLYKLSLRYAEYVMLLNWGSRTFLLNHDFIKLDQLIHLTGGEGIDLLRFSPQQKKPQSNKIVFLMIARPLYDKGYLEYVAAARLIKEKYRNIEFLLLGSNAPHPTKVPLEILQKDVDDGIINYLEVRNDVRPIIESCDCVVLPSYNEGLSRSLMEAIAMGKPVITTDIPGCRETVEDGKNGYLVQPKNKEELKRAFEKFIALTNDERLCMGKYSRQKAEREFDIKNAITVYEKIVATINCND